MASTRRLARIVLFLVIAFALSGCASGDLAPVRDPGRGSSIADRVYLELGPILGEQASAPNPDNSPTVLRLDTRFIEVCERNQDWSYSVLHDDREGRDSRFYRAYGFRDGSRLTFVERPASGPKEPVPGIDSGTELERVELYRP